MNVKQSLFSVFVIVGEDVANHCVLKVREQLRGEVYDSDIPDDA